MDLEHEKRLTEVEGGNPFTFYILKERAGSIGTICC
jgi:hypothetical protein